MLRMGRPRKPPQFDNPLSALIAEHVEAGLTRYFGKYRTRTLQIEALATRASVGEETIRRMLVGEGSPSVDNLESVAKAMGADAATFLKPPEDSVKDSTKSQGKHGGAALERHREKSVRQGGLA